MNNSEITVSLPSICSAEKISKIYPSSQFTLYFDGCSKGNPGSAGIGVVIYKDGEEYWSASKYIGPNKTNNEAEYSGLIFGLQAAQELGIKTLSVYGDSLLVINQINKIYKIKNSNLFELYNEVIKLIANFTYIDFNHVYRKYNKRADQLSNKALENNLKLYNLQDA